VENCFEFEVYSAYRLQRHTPITHDEKVNSVFDGFEEITVEAPGGVVTGVRGGHGPPVLLLHGIPETHLMWRHVAPALAEDFTVVATDLRGYGGSAAPTSSTDHGTYAMRELATDQVAVMEALGHRRFAAVGHDRGARCAFRMTLDHEDAVTALAVLDVVPTADAYARADAAFATAFWLWSFLGAPAPVPERLVGAEPDLLVDHLLDAWSTTPPAPEPEVREAYRRQFRDPVRVHGICEQYRAAAVHDVAHDEGDRQRGVDCAVLVLWSADGVLGRWYDVMQVWRAWAPQARGAAVPGGHFLPEESPDETLTALRPFLHDHAAESG